VSDPVIWLSTALAPEDDAIPSLVPALPAWATSGGRLDRHASDDLIRHPFVSNSHDLDSLTDGKGDDSLPCRDPLCCTAAGQAAPGAKRKSSSASLRTSRGLQALPLRASPTARGDLICDVLDWQRPPVLAGQGQASPSRKPRRDLALRGHPGRCRAAAPASAECGARLGTAPRLSSRAAARPHSGPPYVSPTNYFDLWYARNITLHIDLLHPGCRAPGAAE
jgi:hypothetical protein